MINSSVICLNQEAVKKNIAFLQKKLGSTTKISSVVKANAYGHGIEQMVPMLEASGIDHFAVFDYQEAVRVQKSLSGPHDVMIMGWIPPRKIRNVIERGLEFYVFNLERLEAALGGARVSGKVALVHLEVETGMNRSGLNREELDKALTIISRNRDLIHVRGLCTHLAGAESISNHVRISKQLKLFRCITNLLKQRGLHPDLCHVANSAAAMVYPRARMDLVRVGIMQYGFWSSTETFIHYLSNKKDKKNPLQRVLSWKSQVMSLKEVKTGEFIGYGLTYLAQRPTRVALIPVGYSCGYNRAQSHVGRVLIHGRRCRLISIVNMNMLMADVTHVANVRIGDEVVLIGSQGNQEITVSAFCDNSDQLNYEVLSRLPVNIKRTIRGD